MAIINEQLKKFKEALADIIVSSQGLCTYDACKDVAEREATFLISMLLPEPNVQSSNIKETIRKEIERRTYNAHEMPDSRPDKQFYEGKDVAYGEILAFIDALPEQPNEENAADEKVVKELSEKVPSEITRQVEDALAKQPASEELKYAIALSKARKWFNGGVNQGGQFVLIDIFPELAEGLDPRYSAQEPELPNNVPEYYQHFEKVYELGKKDMKAKMMEGAVERVVKEDAGGYPYIDKTELYDYEKDEPLAKKGDKVMVIFIPEE